MKCVALGIVLLVTVGVVGEVIGEDKSRDSGMSNESVIEFLDHPADWRKGLTILEADFSVQWPLVEQRLNRLLIEQKYIQAGIIAISVASLVRDRDPNFLDDLVDLFDPGIHREGHIAPGRDQIPQMVMVLGLLHRLRDAYGERAWSAPQVALSILQPDQIGAMGIRYALIRADKELLREMSENYSRYRSQSHLMVVSYYAEREIIEREVLSVMLRSALALNDQIPSMARSVYFVQSDYADDLALKLIANELSENDASPGMFRFLSSERRLKNMIERHGALPTEWREVLRPFAEKHSFFSELIKDN